MKLTSFEARKILQVDANATTEDIKKAFRRLASKHHPDKGGNADEFKKIKAAYEKLSSSSGGSSYRSGTKQDEDVWGSDFWNFDSENVADFVNDFIYSRGKYSGGWDAYDQPRSSSSSSTSKVKVRLSVKEAFNGIENKRLVVNSTSPKAFELSISVKPGTANSETLHIQEVDGITYVFVAEIVPPIAVSSGEPAYSVNWSAGTPDYGNIYIKKAINPVTMMQGGWVKVECPIDDTEISVRVVPGTASNTKLKIKGKGYWQNRQLLQRADVILEVIPDIRNIDKYSDSEKGDMIGQLLCSMDKEAVIKSIQEFISSLPNSDAMKLVDRVLDSMYHETHSDTGYKE